MAHLWIQLDQEWTVLPLSGANVELSADSGLPVRTARNDVSGRGVTLAPSGAAGGSDWILLCPPGGCRVNGESVTLGIKALSDRDEILVPRGSRVFFSTEMTARIAPFAGGDRVTLCPRCRLEIKPGQPAVICGCGVAYHEDAKEELLCWTYDECTFCHQSGSLDAGFRWTPDDL